MSLLLDDTLREHCINLVKCLEINGELARISKYLKENVAAGLTSSLTNISGRLQSLDESFGSSSTLLSSRSRVYHLSPEINVIQVTDISPKLGRLIMEDLGLFRRLAQHVFFQLAVNIGCEDIIVEEQLVVTPVVIGLAFFYEHLVRDARHLGPLVSSERLWSSEVTLLGRSQVVKYVSSASYVCTSQECGECRDGTLYVKVGMRVNEGDRYLSPCRCSVQSREPPRR